MYIYDISLNSYKRETFQTKALEKIKARILRSINFFPKNPTVYEIMWKNTVDPGRPQVTI